MLGKHVTEGIELHRLTEGEWDPLKLRMVRRKPTGEKYWKLAIECSQCSKIIDECLCYPSREEMENAKAKAKGSEWTCSILCWFNGMNEENLKYWTSKFEKDIKYHIHEYPLLDGKSREEKIDIVTGWFEDNDLGDDCFTMSEDLESDECPI